MSDTTEVKILQLIPYFAEVGDVVSIATCQVQSWIDAGTAEVYVADTNTNTGS
jgi:hypothetical protein